MVSNRVASECVYLIPGLSQLLGELLDRILLLADHVVGIRLEATVP
jgi:hypothetical protein